jgi:uncharacterized protein YegP (UPF0339 family)
MAIFQIIKDVADEYRWHLRADNNQIIATAGEGYVAKADCEHGIDLVKTLAPEAKVDDQTK